MRVAPADFVPNKTPKIILEEEAILKWRKELIRAIKKRDLTEVALLLDNPLGNIKEILNSGEPVLHIENNESKDNNQYNEDKLRLPIVIAAVYGSIDIVDLLFQKGADIFQKDINETNIIHAIIMVSAFKPSREKSLRQMYRRIMELVVTEEEKKKLLHAENTNGLRPIELAAKYGCFLLLMTMIETEGIYRSVMSETTMSEIVRYDLSEYECFGPTHRRSVSPLVFIRRALVSDLLKEGINEIFRHPVLTKWIQLKYSEIRLGILVAFLTSMLLIVSFILMDDYGHSPSCPANNTVPIISIHPGVKHAILYSSILFDTVMKLIGAASLIRGYYKAHGKYGLKRLQRVFDKDVFGKQHYIVSNTNFLLFYVFNGLEMLVYMIVTATARDWQYAEMGEMMLIIRVTIEISLWWLLLYYIQVMPGIGHLVIGAFRCIGTFVYFILIFVLFFAASTEGMRSVARYYCLDKIGFSFDSVYSTFLIMLNMINIRELTDDETGTPLALILMHFQVVFILVILLINFLIALLSEEIGRIERHKNIIGTLTRLSVALDVWSVYEGVYDLLPRCLQLKRKEFYIEHEEYTL